MEVLTYAIVLFKGHPQTSAKDPQIVSLLLILKVFLLIATGGAIEWLLRELLDPVAGNPNYWAEFPARSRSTLAWLAAQIKGPEWGEACFTMAL